MIVLRKTVYGGGCERQDQQQQQQGLQQMEEEGNRWEEDLVISMSTIMIDKDRVGV
jgi:hypothetical protein